MTAQATSEPTSDAITSIAALLGEAEDFDDVSEDFDDVSEDFDDVSEDSDDASVAASDDASEDSDDASEDSDDASDDASTTWGKALGLDDDKIELNEDGTIAGVKVKVDGRESIVPLKDVIQGFQFNAYNTQKSQHLATLQHEFSQEQLQFQQQAQSSYDIQRQLASVLASQILGPYANIDWDRFMVEKPDEARIAYGEFRARDDYFKNLVSAIEQQVTAHENEHNTLLMAQHQNYAKQQVQELVARIPAWQDTAVAVTQMANISKVATQYGFSSEELSGILDARIYHLLHDFATMKGALNDVQSTVKSVPQKSSINPKRKNADKVNRLVKQAKTASNNYQAQRLKTAAVATLLGDL